MSILASVVNKTYNKYKKFSLRKPWKVNGSSILITRASTRRAMWKYGHNQHLPTCYCIKWPRHGCVAGGRHAQFHCLFSQNGRPVATLRSLTTPWYVSKCFLTPWPKKLNICLKHGGPCISNPAYYSFVDFWGIEDLFPSKHGWHTHICVLPIRYTCSRTHWEDFPHQSRLSYPQPHLPQATVDTYCAICLTTSFSQTTTLTTCSALVNAFQTHISTMTKHNA